MGLIERMARLLFGDALAAKAQMRQSREQIRRAGDRAEMAGALIASLSVPEPRGSVAMRDAMSRSLKNYYVRESRRDDPSDPR